MFDPMDLVAKCIKDKTPVTIYLVNGIKLHGVIMAYTPTLEGMPLMYTLERDQKPQVVMAHAISTILPV